MTNEGQGSKKKESRVKKIPTTAEGKSAKSQSTNVQKLKKDIATLKKEKVELTDRLLRSVAEFENYKKRIERDFAEITIRTNADLVKDILPILDDFERSLDPAHKTGSSKKFKEGIELIFRNLCSKLQERGLEPIEAIGEKFDPEKHDALMLVESKDHPENIVLEEHSKGYKFKDQIIRHSKVIVSK